MIDVNTFFISILKIIIIVPFIFFLISFCHGLYKEIMAAVENNKSFVDILKRKRWKITGIVTLFVMLVFVFNLEPVYRPKTDLNKDVGGAPIMMKDDKELKITPEKKTDYQKMIEKNREENREAVEDFKALD